MVERTAICNYCKKDLILDKELDKNWLHKGSYSTVCSPFKQVWATPEPGSVVRLKVDSNEEN